jgi:hypothetical protein
VGPAAVVTEDSLSNNETMLPPTSSLRFSPTQINIIYDFIIFQAPCRPNLAWTNKQKKKIINTL